MAKCEVERSEAEWREKLSPEAYHVLREKGTERPFTGEYWNNKDSGTYLCGGCANVLFDSQTKYESGSGWPSFWQPKDAEKVILERDTSHGMIRTEVLCARCGSHLGHVFEDGPRPTGQRFCINSAALQFEPEEPDS